MYTLSEEQRWYIINEWKKGSINVLRVARFLNCHVSTIYRVIDYYRRPHNVDYGQDVGHPPTLDSTQIKEFDRSRKSIVKIKSNNINEQKRYEFVLLQYRARIDNYSFEDECYVGLRNTQQVV
jgi:hypothetical protein